MVVVGGDLRSGAAVFKRDGEVASAELMFNNDGGSGFIGNLSKDCCS